MEISWYDWIILAAIFGILLKICIFTIPDVHIGVPSSFFTGRFKKEKVDGNSEPIKIAYAEGLHFKPPWWNIEVLKRSVVTQQLERQAYQVGGKEGSQGSVDITGIIQYRVCQRMAFRRLEVSESDIKDGLDAEFDYLLGRELGDENIKIEEVVTMKSNISNQLYVQLRRENSNSDRYPDDNWRGRQINGEQITWSEHRFGIEILKVNINRIDPSGDLKEERDKRQKELYQKQSQTIEWGNLRERAAELKGDSPDLSSKEIWEIIQTWQGNATREIIDINAPDAIAALTGVLGKNQRKKKE